MDYLTNNPKIQEHWIWKKNVPFIYDYLLITPLRWPALTFSIPPLRFNSENMEIEESSEAELDSEISLHGEVLIYGGYSGFGGGPAGPNQREKFITISMLSTPNFDVDLLGCEESAEEMSKKKLERPKYLSPDISSIFRVVVKDDPVKISSKLSDSRDRIVFASKMLKGEVWLHSIGIDEIYEETFSVRAKAGQGESDAESVRVYSTEDKHQTLLNKKCNSRGTGYGMEWGTANSNWLLSGNEDSSMFVFDVNTCEPIFREECYDSNYGINDVCWVNPDLAPSIFSTVNHQGFLSIYDCRCSLKASSSAPGALVNKWSVSSFPCVSVSVHPSVSNLVGVGDYGGSIYIIDLRCFSSNQKICSSVPNSRGIVSVLKYNTEPVHRLEWHPGGNGLLLSSSLDGRSCIWDITQCSNLPIWDQVDFDKDHGSQSRGVSSSQSPSSGSRRSLDQSDIPTDNPGDPETDMKRSVRLLVNSSSPSSAKNGKSDGPSELLGVHSGHTGQITDSHWMFSPNNDSWMVASTDNLNGLHVWLLNEAVFTSENDLVELSYAKQTSFDKHSIYSTRDTIQNLVKSL
ncbi:WD repeat protein [Cryptosporidium canis]|uniref:WD repeat protein n=1 Tax=Cryptosporidium canis TaxID=195482 RepID=A0ABQ8P7D5_9CRYT|nr:WD repeat protein [Cryptosporidium canis]KAJ1611049.1 WD repeat protein [Cryptosporidium canis]